MRAGQCGQANAGQANAGQANAGQANAGQAGAGQAGAGTGATDAAATPGPADIEAFTAQLDQQRHDDLAAELAGTGLPAPRADGLATTLLGHDVATLDGATQRLYADAARAEAALQAGDVGGARDRVRTTADDYRTLLAPIVAVRDPALDSATRDLLARSEDLVGLRRQDLALVTSQIDAAARSALGAPAPANVGLERAVATVWAGWVRLIVLLVFGILAFVPLYLLNLAFGGGNRNWQLIGVSLFLLLLPLVYEALAAVGSLVAMATGNDSFDILATYSMFHSTLGQAVWVVLVAFAILFAISGLYGICVQFGLLGRQRSSAGTSATQTVTATGAGSREPAESLVDWDEDF